MGLSNEDWNRLDRMREEDRNHLDSITEKLDSDSVRQWQHIAALRTDLEVHKAASSGLHDRPCETALALQKDHVEKSVAHNPKVVIPTLAGLFTIASVVGAWLYKLILSILPKASPPAQIVLVAVGLALVGGGCSSPNSTVYEEDRQLVDMNIQILKKRAAVHQVLLAAASHDPAGLFSAAKEIEQLDYDALANSEQLQDNFGKPDQAVPYTPEAAKVVRESSAKKHTTGVGFWGWVGGALLTGGGMALAIARSPFARMIPGFGPIFSAFDTVIVGVEKFMATQKAKGNKEAATELAETLLDEQAAAKVDSFVTKRLNKVKKKIAPALEAIADMTPSPSDETRVLPRS